MNFFPILLSVAESAEKAVENTSSAPFNNALWQFPVAALVVLVVFFFIRHQRKEREAQQKFLAETNKLDREDRELAQKRFSDTIEQTSKQHDQTTQRVVESFQAAHTQATNQTSALMAKAVDTIDRNTEMFGEVRALVEITRNQRVMRDKKDKREEE